MKNVKRILLCVIALMLVCQMAFASVDISGAWFGTLTAIGYKLPKLYAVIEGEKEGTIRLVIPNVGSGNAIKANYRWAYDLAGENENLYINMTIMGKQIPLMIYEKDVIAKGGSSLRISGTLPFPVMGTPFSINVRKYKAAIGKVSSKAAKVGVASDIKITTSPVTDYVVLTDKDFKVLAIDDTVVARVAEISYSGWTKGKNVFYVLPGLKDGNGNVKIKAAVGSTLTVDDLLVLGAPVKFKKSV